VLIDRARHGDRVASSMQMAAAAAAASRPSHVRTAKLTLQELGQKFNHTILFAHSSSTLRSGTRNKHCTLPAHSSTRVLVSP